MDTSLNNPVIPDDFDFSAAADQADHGDDITVDQTKPEVAAPEPQAEAEPEQPEATPDKAKERPRDAQGRFTKTENGEDIPEAERAPVEAAEKPAASEYEVKKQEKAKKEQERLEKTWENVNRRKEELEARERALAQAQQQRQQQAQQPQQKRQFSSQELFTAHQDFKGRAKEALKNGDYDAFNENEALAEQSLQHAQQFYQVEQQEAQQAQFNKWNDSWRANAQKIIEADPEIANTESPLGKAITSLMQTHGNLAFMVQDGFAKIVDMAKMRLEATTAGEMREANKKLQSELDRLNGLTSISGSGPSSQPAKKSFNNMTDSEQDAWLRTHAAAIDAG